MEQFVLQGNSVRQTPCCEQSIRRIIYLSENCVLFLYSLEFAYSRIKWHIRTLLRERVRVCACARLTIRTGCYHQVYSFVVLMRPRRVDHQQALNGKTSQFIVM